MNTTNKTGQIVFSIIFFCICIIPFAGLAVAPDQQASDSDSLSDAPQLIDGDGQPNLAYLSDAGTYFEDHFAFRDEAIELNARMQVGLFATSPTDQVIVGTDGWLYYGGTLADYQGESRLSEREVENIAHNLELIQNYAEDKGVSFVFTIAPNKNSIYPEHMPYYHLRGQNDNMERLKVRLDERGVNYIDLFSLFEEREEELYYKTDTHWTPEGNLLVSNTLLEAVSYEAQQPEALPSKSAFIGDLETMLYPATAGRLQASGNQSAVASGEGGGRLLLYGDSFSKRLLPFLSPQFSETHLFNEMPYEIDRGMSLQPDVIVVELVERNIIQLGEYSPIMMSLVAETNQYEQIWSHTAFDWYQEGGYRVIEGWVDETVMSDESDILVTVKGPNQQEVVYTPFYFTKARAELGDTPFGYKMYLDEDLMSDGLYEFKVIVESKETNTSYVVLEHSLQYKKS